MIFFPGFIAFLGGHSFLANARCLLKYPSSVTSMDICCVLFCCLKRKFAFFKSTQINHWWSQWFSHASTTLMSAWFSFRMTECLQGWILTCYHYGARQTLGFFLSCQLKVCSHKNDMQENRY